MDAKAREIIDGWRAWHDKIGTVLGAKFNNRDVTMQKAEEATAEIARLTAEVEREKLRAEEFGDEATRFEEEIHEHLPYYGQENGHGEIEDSNAIEKIEFVARDLAHLEKRAEKAEARVQYLDDTLDSVLKDTARDLGCDPDNEQILSAIHTMKARVAELEAQAAKDARLAKLAREWFNAEGSVETRVDARIAMKDAIREEQADG